MRKSVELFAKKMEDKLKTRDDDLGTEGWLDPDLNVEYLIKRIKEKIVNVETSLKDCNAKTVHDKSTDIANFAMMISDRLRGRFTK